VNTGFRGIFYTGNKAPPPSMRAVRRRFCFMVGIRLKPQFPPDFQEKGKPKMQRNTAFFSLLKTNQATRRPR
jgi:hypothetical protein